MDITMCIGQDCPLKETCLRYKGEKDKYQSMFLEPPYIDSTCEYHYKIKEDTPLTSKEEMERFYKHIYEILDNEQLRTY